MIPQICDIDRLKRGGEHWQWDPNIPFYVGVLPRKGAKGSDVKVSSLCPRNRYHEMMFLTTPYPSGSEHQMLFLVT